MRYMLRHEKNRILANGDTGLLVGHYRSDANARRYLIDRLARTPDDRFPPGNYVIQTWPESGSSLAERKIASVYKRV